MNEPRTEARTEEEIREIMSTWFDMDRLSVKAGEHNWNSHGSDPDRNDSKAMEVFYGWEV